MGELNKLFVSLDLLECGRLFNKSKECFDQAKSKKQKSECMKIYNEYQFCLTKAESEKLEKDKYWLNFKDKWGHFPNETKDE